jgi:hypothetical protein
MIYKPKNTKLHTYKDDMHDNNQIGEVMKFFTKFRLNN